MNYIIFTGIVVMCWMLLKRSVFMKTSGLSTPVWSLLYLIKVFAGVTIGWISFKYYPQGSDYSMIHREGLINYEMLKQDPVFFIKDFFTSYYGNFDDYLASTGSYWSDLKNNVIIKYVAIVNLISRGNYYINSLFFTIPGFVASVALYKSFMRFYARQKSAVVAGTMLLPSTIYFSSGIHKDAVVFIALCLFTYACMHLEKLSRKQIIYTIVSSLLLLLVRNFVLAALIPAAIAFRLAIKYNQRIATLLVYGSLSLLLIFTALTSLPNPAQIIATKQQAFLQLPVAKSQIPLYPLDGSYTALFRAIPQSLYNIIAEPNPFKFNHSLLLYAGIEWYVYICILFAGFLYAIKTKHFKQPMVFCLLFTLPLCLFIGWIVPNAGSLVRYRALYLPWLITPFLSILFIQMKHIRYKNM